MRIPKKIKFLGKEYNIVFVKALKNKSVKLWGELIYTKSLIKVEKKCARSFQESILLHELIHIISEDMFIDLSEEQVSCLATGLYGMITENKLFKK